MRVIFSSLFLISSFAACGDDATTTPDGPNPPPIDAPASTFKGFGADEGGEVRVEYVRFAAGNVGTRVDAFLWDPGPTKMFPFPNLNGCTDFSTPTNWPMATNPLASRTYLDPGHILIAGGPHTLDVERVATQGRDPLFREHPANKWFFHFGGGDCDPGPCGPKGGASTDGTYFIPEKTRFDVAFTGSADMPAQIFDDVLYSPSDFALQTPDVTPVAIQAGTDQTFTWDVGSDTTTPVDEEHKINSLVAFTGGAQGPVVICVEPNDGSVTVPGSFIDIARAKYPQGGTLARQTFTHVVRELVDKNGPTGRRIDFITVWCYATAFTVP